MKKNDILKKANAKVAEYMANGYIISWGNSARGHEFSIDLENGEDFVRVYVEHYYGSPMEDRLIDALALKVVKLDYAGAFETRGREPLFSKVYYNISSYFARYPWYSENAADMENARNIRSERREAQRMPTEYLTPSIALIGKLKGHKGFSNANRKNVTVTRDYRGYVVSILNRNTGAIARTEIFRFKNAAC